MNGDVWSSQFCRQIAALDKLHRLAWLAAMLQACALGHSPGLLTIQACESCSRKETPKHLQSQDKTRVGRLLEVVSEIIALTAHAARGEPHRDAKPGEVLQHPRVLQLTSMIKATCQPKKRASRSMVLARLTYFGIRVESGTGRRQPKRSELN